MEREAAPEGVGGGSSRAVLESKKPMKPEIRRILADLRTQLESVYGQRLVAMILFGSQARGDAEPGSDIDVAVVLKGKLEPGKEISRTGKIVTALSLKYDAVLSCIFVSAERFSKEETPLLLNVRNEGVSL